MRDIITLIIYPVQLGVAPSQRISQEMAESRVQHSPSCSALCANLCSLYTFTVLAVIAVQDFCLCSSETVIFLNLQVFRDRVSLHILGCPGSHSVVQAGLEPRDPLCLPLKCLHNLRYHQVSDCSLITMFLPPSKASCITFPSSPSNSCPLFTYMHACVYTCQQTCICGICISYQRA